ncbi:uncharacterized protein HGUI_01039 [Hanseniaspora guilliermondii]|uniref:SAGA-associated factor 11 n=1 Tax=Hanseniaspora guilliermondii TaxID=56406 RepID=A0A1L0CVL7_9ASCO|nr:uncharacterized protein HGUI_01039 [Hanseniaspora guilliermondii]
MSEGIEHLADILLEEMIASIVEKEITTTYLDLQEPSKILRHILANKDNSELFNSNNMSVFTNSTGSNSSKSTNNDGSENVQYIIPTTSQITKNLLPEKIYKMNQDSPDLTASNSNEDKFTKETSLDIILSQSNTPNIQPNGMNLTSSNKNPMTNIVNSTNNTEAVYVKCDVCKRELLSNRFAQHLERCLTGKTR